MQSSFSRPASSPRILLRIKAGEEPVPEPLAAALAGGPTVADLARHYLEDHVAVRCKAKTEENYWQAIAKHIAPALGRHAPPRPVTKHRYRLQPL